MVLFFNLNIRFNNGDLDSSVLSLANVETLTSSEIRESDEKCSTSITTETISIIENRKIKKPKNALSIIVILEKDILVL